MESRLEKWVGTITTVPFFEKCTGFIHITLNFILLSRSFWYPKTNVARCFEAVENALKKGS